MSTVFKTLIDLTPQQRLNVVKGMDFESQKMILSEIDAYEKEQCKDLRMFVKYAWPSVEPYAFKNNWHLDAICEHLQAVTEGHIKKLIINIPPRMMKSLSCCVFWPAWEWGLVDPCQAWVYASHSMKLSNEHSVKCRDLIMSDWYQGHFGDEVNILDDQNTMSRFVNTNRGVRMCTSVGGSVTGFGGNRLIVDDPLDADKANSAIERDNANRWWSETMSSRLNDHKTGSRVVIMQRLHENDLTGYLLAKEQGYEHLCIPMRHEPSHPHKTKTSITFTDPRTYDGEVLFPDMMDDTILGHYENDMGSYSVAGQLQQRPAPRDSGMFKREWFEIVDKVPDKIRHKVRHWDLAASEKRTGNDPDWTVGLKLVLDDKGVFYIVDIVRFRESAQYVEESIKSSAEQDGKSTIISLPIDPGQAGVMQSQYLVKQLAGFYANKVVSQRESGSKITRANPVEAQAEAGNIKLVRAHWNDSFLNEVEVFPNGRYDDQVDSLSGAFGVLVKYRKRFGSFNLADMAMKSIWK